MRAKKIKYCVWCGKEIIKPRKNQVTCSTDCQRKRNWNKVIEYRKTGEYPREK